VGQHRWHRGGARGVPRGHTVRVRRRRAGGRVGHREDGRRPELPDHRERRVRARLAVHVVARDGPARERPAEIHLAAAHRRRRQVRGGRRHDQRRGRRGGGRRTGRGGRRPRGRRGGGRGRGGRRQCRRRGRRRRGRRGGGCGGGGGRQCSRSVRRLR